MNTKYIDEPRQTALDALSDYIYFVEEMGAWSGLSPKEQSYCKFAGKELQSEIRQGREPPLIVLEKFAERMRNAHNNKYRPFDESLFYSAAQVADHIIMSLTS